MKFVAAAPSVSCIVAFGDSYSDSGQSGAMSSSQLSGEIMALPQMPNGARQMPAVTDSSYFQAGHGRWTNGPTAVEVLAAKLGVGLKGYAVGGAKTDRSNYDPWMDVRQNSGLLGQIEKFSLDLNGETADPLALYFIFVSANDYFAATDNDAHDASAALPARVRLADIADAAVANIAQAVRQLAVLGAQQFMVVNSSDLSVVPKERLHNRSEGAAVFVRRINATLPAVLSDLRNQLQVDMTLFDHAGLSTQVRANPAQYGLVEIDEPYCLALNPGQSAGAGQSACINPDQHYFWDEWHPTTAFHQIVGEAMAAQLIRATLP